MRKDRGGKRGKGDHKVSEKEKEERRDCYSRERM
jgi:hypothetical protein